MAAAIALERGDLAAAEQRLRPLLRSRPTSVAAIRLMAMLAIRLGREGDGIALLARALELAPGFLAAREMRARTLQRANRFEEAITDVEVLRASAPGNPSLAMLHAALLVRLGRQKQAADLYRETLAHHPDNVAGWLSFGHVLKAIGQVPEAIAAYHRAIALRPGYGEAWWSLANLKTVRFEPTDIAAMEQALPGSADETDRLHLHFALGKAHEDLGDAAEAFGHYSEGNRLRRTQIGYEADTVTRHVDVMAGALSQGAFTAPSSPPRPLAGPIFVVGLPRSGSTLVEQILASHPLVEGTSELPNMMMIAERLAERAETEGTDLPAVLRALTPDERAALGQEYLAQAALHRHEATPLFTDKMPNNWQNVALIKLLLPHARIVDVRRHPMAVGWSAYKQHFARGQEFSYDQVDLARYYRDYARLMAAFDAASPGQVHRVIYERLVEDTEHEVRRILAALGLPFAEACLQFWKNERVVRTPSSEQVRRPVFRDALTHWHNFAPWLQPMRDTLGPLEHDYDKT